jgi:hypothetical protein
VVTCNYIAGLIIVLHLIDVSVHYHWLDLRRETSDINSKYVLYTRRRWNLYKPETYIFFPKYKYQDPLLPSKRVSFFRGLLVS